jgi:hypothetical protein
MTFDLGSLSNEIPDFSWTICVSWMEEDRWCIVITTPLLPPTS